MPGVRRWGQRPEPRALNGPRRCVPLWLTLALPLVVASPVVATSPSPAAAGDAGSTLQAIELTPPDSLPLADPVTMPSGARIAYVVGAGSDEPLVRLIAADGSGDSRVAVGVAPAWQPPPFASGEVLAFECTPPSETGPPTAVCLDELESFWDALLVSDAREPRWSPTADALTFERVSDAVVETWVVDLADFHPRSSEEDPGSETRLPGVDPRWSPTGDRLLVSVGSEIPVLSVVRPDGREVRTVGEGLNGTWSPDGRFVASTTWDGTTSTVTATSIFSGAQRELAAIAGQIIALRWLPGDGLVVLLAGDGLTVGGDLYAIELSDGSARSLSGGQTVRPDLSVSPDGAWVAFSAEDEDGQDIYVAARSGGWKRLTDSGDAMMPAWGSFRPLFEPGAFVQPMVARLRARSRPWIGEDSIRYEPLLSQRNTLEVLQGPVAGSGYWWYRVRPAAWEELRLRGGPGGRTRAGWVAAADHDGSAWLGRVDVDPGPASPRPRVGWPIVRRGDIRLRAAPPSIGADGSLTLETTVRGLRPGTVLTLVARGDAKVAWRCGSEIEEASGEARDWADVSAGPDGTGRATLELLPPLAVGGLCRSDASTPIATDAHWEEVHVREGLHRLELRPPAETRARP